MLFRRTFSLICFLSVLLAGCATSPYEGDGKTQSDARLTAQMQAADKQVAASSGSRILFAGFAMNSLSKAFRHDVALAEKFVKSLDPNAVVFKLDNPAWGESAVWPYATAENMERVMAKLSALARPQDKVVILMATHGYIDTLSINFSEKHYPHINSKWLNYNLRGLKGTPTLLVLSACYSGSFINPLATPNRIILTAAAPDRSSFGCSFHSSNTYFVEALLNQPLTPGLNIKGLMENAKQKVNRLEVQMKLTPPSLPQFFVGRNMQSWANQPVTEWLSSAPTSQ